MWTVEAQSIKTTAFASTYSLVKKFNFNLQSLILKQFVVY